MNIYGLGLNGLVAYSLYFKSEPNSLILFCMMLSSIGGFLSYYISNNIEMSDNLE